MRGRQQKPRGSALDGEVLSGHGFSRAERETVQRRFSRERVGVRGFRPIIIGQACHFFTPRPPNQARNDMGKG